MFSTQACAHEHTQEQWPRAADGEEANHSADDQTKAYGADLPAMKGVGVAELLRHLRGELTLAQTIALAQRATRRYAKRQITWFRHQLEHDRVQRLVTDAPGWQETVDRWLTELETTMRMCSS